MTTRDKILNAALLLAFFGLFAMAKAHAQTRSTPCNAATPNNAICIVATAPTLREDNTPITGTLTYRTERQSGSSWVAVGTTSVPRVYVENLSPGTYTFRMIAIEGAVESAPSNTASREATAPPPSPPKAPVIQVVKVTISSDYAPVYRIAGDGKSLTYTMFGLVPYGRTCGEYVTTWRKLAWHRIVIRNPEKELWGTKDASELAAPCAPRA